MTVKSMRPTQLPLLGSNQDSPDPESDARLRRAGAAEKATRGFPSVADKEASQRHTISHPLPLLVRGADWVGSPIVYGLVDPLEPTRIRYVGRTSQMPTARYVQHLTASHGNGRARSVWVTALLDAGRAPDMVLLESVKNPRALEKREMEWIRDMKAAGMADLNGSLPTWFTTGDRAEEARRRKLGRFKRTGVR